LPGGGPPPEVILGGQLYNFLVQPTTMPAVNTTIQVQCEQPGAATVWPTYFVFPAGSIARQVLSFTPTTTASSCALQYSVNGGPRVPVGVMLVQRTRLTLRFIDRSTGKPPSWLLLGTGVFNYSVQLNTAPVLQKQMNMSFTNNTGIAFSPQADGVLHFSAGSSTAVNFSIVVSAAAPARTNLLSFIIAGNPWFINPPPSWTFVTQPPQTLRWTSPVPPILVQGARLDMQLTNTVATGHVSDVGEVLVFPPRAIFVTPAFYSLDQMWSAHVAVSVPASAPVGDVIIALAPGPSFVAPSNITVRIRPPNPVNLTLLNATYGTDLPQALFPGVSYQFYAIPTGIVDVHVTAAVRLPPGSGITSQYGGCSFYPSSTPTPRDYCNIWLTVAGTAPPCDNCTLDFTSLQSWVSMPTPFRFRVPDAPPSPVRISLTTDQGAPPPTLLLSPDTYRYSFVLDAAPSLPMTLTMRLSPGDDVIVHPIELEFPVGSTVPVNFTLSLGPTGTLSERLCFIKPFTYTWVSITSCYSFTPVPPVNLSWATLPPPTIFQGTTVSGAIQTMQIPFDGENLKIVAVGAVGAPSGITIAPSKLSFLWPKTRTLFWVTAAADAPLGPVTLAVIDSSAYAQLTLPPNITLVVLPPVCVSLGVLNRTQGIALPRSVIPGNSYTFYLVPNTPPDVTVTVQLVVTRYVGGHVYLTQVCFLQEGNVTPEPFSLTLDKDVEPDQTISITFISFQTFVTVPFPIHLNVVRPSSSSTGPGPAPPAPSSTAPAPPQPSSSSSSSSTGPAPAPPPPPSSSSTGPAPMGPALTLHFGTPTGAVPLTIHAATPYIFWLVSSAPAAVDFTVQVSGDVVCAQPDDDVIIAPSSLWFSASSGTTAIQFKVEVTRPAAAKLLLQFSSTSSSVSLPPTGVMYVDSLPPSPPAAFADPPAEVTFGLTGSAEMLLAAPWQSTFTRATADSLGVAFSRLRVMSVVPTPATVENTGTARRDSPCALTLLIAGASAATDLAAATVASLLVQQLGDPSTPLKAALQGLAVTITPVPVVHIQCANGGFYTKCTAPNSSGGDSDSSSFAEGVTFILLVTCASVVLLAIGAVAWKGYCRRVVTAQAAPVPSKPPLSTLTQQYPLHQLPSAPSAVQLQELAYYPSLQSPHPLSHLQYPAQASAAEVGWGASGGIGNADSPPLAMPVYYARLA
jgi:hypothetical protein